MIISNPGSPLRILLAVDGSPDAAAAVNLLTQIAWPAETFTHVLMAAPEHWWLGGLATGISTSLVEEAVFSTSQSQQMGARALTRQVVDRLRDHNLLAQAEVCPGPATQVILERAMRLAVHLVVVGAKGLHASEQATLGSTADSVAHYPYASYSVLVARPSAQVQPLNIILVVDGSSETWRAVEFLCALSLPDWAKVTMVTVNDERIDIPAYVISQERRQQAGSLSLGPTFAEGYTTTVLERLHKCGTQGWSNVCSGDPVEAILTAAQEQEADLVVIGARGHPCPNPLCLGNVAERVIKNASCSVLAVR